MGDTDTNHYEQQLYSVFKSFDVNNEESLDESAVNNLCDALQLEERGAALVDTLFERRAGRVTFAQFRSGLLAVLGEPRAAPPPPPPPPELSAPPSDEESSGREVAPKFVLGVKKYGRRSRPQKSTSGEERSSPRAASESRLESEDGSPPQRPRYRRSASAAERRDDASPPPLEHDRRIDRDEALALCRTLCMHSIDRHLVERIFEDSPTTDTTVGEFFDRLNASLASAADATTDGGDEPDEEEAGVAAERVAEAWEAAGVRRPRRLLAELGFGGGALRPLALERALDDELRAFDTPLDERSTLLAAALTLTRLRAEAARAARLRAAAERDKLRADVAEANRRAALLAQEVDDNHARIETELKAGLRRAEARHSEEIKRAEAEAAAERERAACERGCLEVEAVRLREAEARLRGEMDALRQRAEEMEARALAAEARLAGVEQERARLAERARAAEAARAAVGEEGGAVAELRARCDDLVRDNRRLRDRLDEVAADLERAPRPMLAHLKEAGVGTDAELTPPDHEKLRLLDTVKELEGAVEALRGEYEACEEYWGGKLREERAAHDADAAAAERRLADLVARIADFERRLQPAPPALAPIPEAAALEAQVAALEAEAARARADLTARLRAALDQLARVSARLAALQRRRAPPAPAPARAPAPCPQCAGARGAGAREAWARCGRAEAGERRLAARLAAADLLVKELYVENCQLAHAARPPAPT